MKKPPTKKLSDLELNLLRHLAASEGLTVREVTETYGKEHGYARTTVQTLLERLRTKGYATRRPVDNGAGFVYVSSLSPADLMQSVVGKFVSRALGGSVSPLVAYLIEQGDLNEEEVKRLRSMLDQLEENAHE
jgi:predicted transcriptional regulator